MRRTLLLALTAVLLPASPVIAAAKSTPPCPPIITDRSGDSYFPELDVVSVDAKSDRKAVVITLSVAGSLVVNTVPGSKEWLVSFVLGKHAYQVRRRSDYKPDGQYDTYYVFYNGHISQHLTASQVKTTASSMQWNVPRSWVWELTKPAAKDNRTYVDWHTDTSWYGFGFDAANADRAYVDQAGCWKELKKKA